MTAFPALRPVGPAQSDWVCHFCGRPPGTGVSTQLAGWIAGLTPQQRLENILWTETLLGSVPFGATNRMVCLSESPPEHLLWLLRERSFPGWGLLFNRQWAYNFAGGPVWYARDEQYQSLPAEHRDWAVRLDAGTSDWLHEREWRIRVQPQYCGLRIMRHDITAILVEDPTWAPWCQIQVPTGQLIGVDGLPSENGVVEETRPEWKLPPLWMPERRLRWNRATQQLLPVS